MGSEAKGICTHFGSRLCTRAEIKDEFTRGSGCSLDRRLIWSSTSTAVYFVVCGKGTGCSERDENVAFTDELHEVRCCKDEAASGFQNKRCRDVWAASDLGGCHFQKTYAEAVGICAGYDSRLCTRAEISNSCTKGSGCSIDNQLIWSSSLASRSVTSSP